MTLVPPSNVVSLKPALVERRLQAAIAAEYEGDAERALAEVNAALDLDRREPRAEALASIYCALLDRDRDALTYARRALSRLATRPEHGVEVAYWAGVARLMVGADTLAVEAFEIVLALDPEDPAARALVERCRGQDQMASAPRPDAGGVPAPRIAAPRYSANDDEPPEDAG